MDSIDREQAIAEMHIAFGAKPAVHAQAVDVLNSLPSAEKTGKWLHSDVVHIITNLIEGDAPQSLTCSRCGFKHKFSDEYGYSCIWHYCPNCGTKMEEGRKNEHIN